MPSKYNRFVLSTCLSVIVLSTGASAPVYAGFEWLPPATTVTPSAEMGVDTLIPVPVPVEDIVSEPIEAPEVVQESVPEKVIAEPSVLVDDAQVTAPAELIETPVVEDVVVSEPVLEKPAVEEKVEPQHISPEPVVEQMPVNVKPEEPIVSEITEVEAIQKQPETPVVMPVDDAKPEVKNISNGENGGLVIEAFPQDMTPLEESHATPESKPKAPAEHIVWSELETFDMIEGFGAEMPLALALRQIVPAKYAFSFGKGINPGQLVSWNGGKPWNDVLTETLATVHYAFDFKGEKIVLYSTQVPAPVAAPVIPEVNNAPPASPVSEVEESGVSVDQAQDIVADVIKTEDAVEGDLYINPTPELDETVAPVHPQEQEVLMPMGDEAVVSPPSADQDGASLGKRTNIVDPGEIESVQPQISKLSAPEMPADQKKN